MSITVSMAGGNTNVQNMNPMMGQMQMSSLQMPGMNTVCPEQVSGTSGTLATYTCHTTCQFIIPRKIRYVPSYLSKITTRIYSIPLSFDNCSLP